MTNEQLLTIRLTRDDILFSLYDAAATDAARLYQSYRYGMRPKCSAADNLSEALREMPYSDVPADAVRVVVGSQVALIPLGDFYPEEATVLYGHNFPSAKDVQVLFNKLPTLDLAILFAVDISMYELLLERFPEARYYAMESGLLERFYRRSRMGEHQKMAIYLHDGLAGIYFFDKGKLQYANTFKADAADDVAYYVLSVWQMFQLDVEHDELLIYGSTPQVDGLKTRLERYLCNVYPMSPNTEFNRAALSRVEGVPFDLLSLLLMS
jgi:hypothetical protein